MPSSAWHTGGLDASQSSRLVERSRSLRQPIRRIWHIVSCSILLWGLSGCANAPVPLAHVPVIICRHACLRRQSLTERYCDKSGEQQGCCDCSALVTCEVVATVSVSTSPHTSQLREAVQLARSSSACAPGGRPTNSNCVKQTRLFRIRRRAADARSSSPAPRCSPRP